MGQHGGGEEIRPTCAAGHRVGRGVRGAGAGACGAGAGDGTGATGAASGAAARSGRGYDLGRGASRRRRRPVRAEPGGARPPGFHRRCRLGAVRPALGAAGDGEMVRQVAARALRGNRLARGASGPARRTCGGRPSLPARTGHRQRAVSGLGDRIGAGRNGGGFPARADADAGADSAGGLCARSLRRAGGRQRVVFPVLLRRVRDVVRDGRRVRRVRAGSGLSGLCGQHGLHDFVFRGADGLLAASGLAGVAIRHGQRHAGFQRAGDRGAAGLHALVLRPAGDHAADGPRHPRADLCLRGFVGLDGDGPLPATAGGGAADGHGRGHTGGGGGDRRVAQGEPDRAVLSAGLERVLVAGGGRNRPAMESAPAADGAERLADGRVAAGLHVLPGGDGRPRPADARGQGGGAGAGRARRPRGGNPAGGRARLAPHPGPDADGRARVCSGFGRGGSLRQRAFHAAVRL